MKYIIEIFHKDQVEDCLEQRTFSEPPWGIPSAGDTFHIEFANPSLTEEFGPRWRVENRRILMFGPDSGVHTIQLFCKPLKPGTLTIGHFEI